jgi:hypothetical protein
MKPIHIEFIEHSDHRYSTTGDYFHEPDRIVFRITRFQNPVYSMAVLIHELWEELRTRQAGIKEEDITKFDIESGLDDPGLSPDAPYHRQHMEADALERMCIVMAGEDWVEYENAIESLYEKEPADAPS